MLPLSGHHTVLTHLYLLYLLMCKSMKSPPNHQPLSFVMTLVSGNPSGEGIIQIRQEHVCTLAKDSPSSIDILLSAV